MHLSLNAVACAMRTKNSGVQDSRARSARYPERANVVWFDLDVPVPPLGGNCRKRGVKEGAEYEHRREQGQQ